MTEWERLSLFSASDLNFDFFGGRGKPSLFQNACATVEERRFSAAKSEQYRPVFSP